MNINGLRIIIQSPYTQQIKRTWKERLFTLPWTPLQRYKTEYVDLIPDGEVIVDKVNSTVYCNPRMYDKIKRTEI